MRILQIASGTEINGALVHCQALSNDLARAGQHVTQLCRPSSWLSNQPLGNFARVESKLNRFSPGEVRRLSRWILDQEFDVIHTHMSRAHNIGVLLSWHTGLPVVATAHNCYLQLHWRFNDFVIANSRATETFQRKVNRIPPAKIRTIHCAVDLQRFLNAEPRQGRFVRGEMRLTKGEYIVGVIGEVAPRKGQIEVIRALPELVRAIPEIRIVFVGRFHRDEAYTRAMRKLQIKHQLHRRVKWLGIRHNVPDHLKAFDLCLIPSREEPLGLVAAEAQAAETPVIASNVGGLPEIVRHQETGLLIPAKSPNAIAAAIRRLYHDRNLAQTMAARAKQSVQQMFNSDRLVSEVLGVYRHVISARTRRRTG